MIPVDFKERMKGLLSETEYDEFIDSFEREEDRIRALRVNRTKCPDKTFSEISVPWEETGYYYDSAVPFGKHPYHEAGLYYIQEASAMAPVHFLDVKPGDRVLDLCAAPGGKSTQIGAALKGEGLLVSNEINRDRAKILSLNIERMGITNALVLSEDSAHLSEVFEGYFDKILVDAPCSGEGMFRKNENASDEWSIENVKMCAERQSEILDNAAKMLAPGGRLVYSTCTFSPEENEENIYGFLLRHVDFHTEETELIGGMEHGRISWISVRDNTTHYTSLVDSLGNDDRSSIVTTDEPGKCSDAAINEVSNSVRLWPNRVKGEGHVLCVLKRDGSSDTDASKSYVPGGRNVKAKKEVIKIFEEFAGDVFIQNNAEQYDIDIKDDSMTLNLASGLRVEGIFLSFGDQLYLAPKDMPSIVGLKVLRPGLHLGTVKKDRFEPSHALALVLSPADVNFTVDFPSDSPEIDRYLNGESIRSIEGIDKNTKGWCLVTTDSYSIGWGKYAGGMLKNHYPKGLRIQ